MFSHQTYVSYMPLNTLSSHHTHKKKTLRKRIWCFLCELVSAPSTEKHHTNVVSMPIRTRSGIPMALDAHTDRATVPLGLKWDQKKCTYEITQAGSTCPGTNATCSTGFNMSPVSKTTFESVLQSSRKMSQHMDRSYPGPYLVDFDNESDPYENRHALKYMNSRQDAQYGGYTHEYVCL